MSVTLDEAFYAKIALNKSLLKEYKTTDYSRVVYMDNKSEFQIQLFNPTYREIGVKISINGKTMSDMLILRPAERIWLERYLNSANKFLFETYTIDDSGIARSIERAAGNGQVKIEFYRVRENGQYSLQPTVYYSSSLADNVNTKLTLSDDSYRGIAINRVVSDNATAANYVQTVTSTNVPSYSSSISTLSCSNASCCDKAISTKEPEPSQMETGRIGKGSYSNQKFSYVDMDFEYSPFKTEIITILPSSRKVIESADLKKRYCPECGRKVSNKHKFCPYCGSKLN